jgi:RNA polymerase sigma factor (sigma-70 family)
MTAVPHWETVEPSGTDGDLVRASTAGDRTAFAQLYDRYADRLHDFCAGMLADRDGAADCVQDTFCIAATRLPQLRDPDKLRPWLYSIARNEALRRIRGRRRETPSEELPDMASDDAGPDTLAARTELADLIAAAAGGLSDRDRSVLELAFRHGLSGPDLAHALDVTPATANTIVKRLRDTIERSLGALLVSRRVRSNGGCGELAGILDGWDGHFNVLMRKRISRHIESCASCDEERRRLVTPAALLGAAPAFIPAPQWLRERTLSEIELTSATKPLGGKRDRRGPRAPVAAFVVALLAAAALAVAWVNTQPATTVPPPITVSEAVRPPAMPAPPVIEVPPSVPVTPPPPPQWTPRVAPPTSVVPQSVPELTPEPEPTPQPSPEPPPPPPPPPDWTDWLPPLPRWPLPPPPPPPGGDFTGPGDLAAPSPGGSAVP